MNHEQLLAKLVSVKSVFPNEHKMAEILETILKEKGFKTRRQYISKNRFNVLAERGNAKNSILLYGHMDTVPIYGEWKTNPLKLTQKSGKLYGIGSRDMKGGIAAILNGADLGKDKKIKILFCVDEENISEGAWSAVTRSKMWFKDVRLIISADGANSKISEGGASFITLGRRGRCVFVIKVKGIAAHGADSGKGISALEEASKIVCNINKLHMRKHKLLGTESAFVRTISSSSTSLSLPEEATLELDVHMVPPSTKATFKTNIDKFIKELKTKNIIRNETKISVSIKDRKTPYLEAYVTPKTDRYVSKVIAIMRENVGKVIYNYGNSVADDNVFANELAIPVITIWPLGGNGHANNEWVSKKSLKELVGIYGSIIKEL